MKFNFEHLSAQYREIQKQQYKVLTCEQYYDLKKANQLPEKCLVNRVDIDFSVKKAEMLFEIFESFQVKASFFIRLHAPEYNPFSFENYRIIKRIIDAGHEIGYHSEIIDQAAIWQQNPEDCLKRDIATMETMFNTKIVGVASHGGSTGLNNLDFWQNHHPESFGLKYEAYQNDKDFNLFNTSLYVSDSEWIRWKAYLNGTRLVDDTRSLAEHIQAEKHPLVYFLIHPDTYYKSHFYE